MGLPTNHGSAAPPTIKLPNPGNTVTFAVIDSNPNALMFEYGSGEPVMNRRGEQKRQTVLTVLVIVSDGATIGGATDARPAAAGDVGSIYIEGYSKWDPDQDKLNGSHVSFGAAVDKLPGGSDSFDIGCVGQWKHLGELASRGSFPRMNRKFAFRLPKPEEGGQTQRCRELHDARANEPAMATSVGGGRDEFDPEEEPF